MRLLRSSAAWRLIALSLILQCLVQDRAAALRRQPLSIATGTDLDMEVTDEEPLDWVLAEDPPEVVPNPVLHEYQGVAASPKQAQNGVLVMSHWFDDGKPLLQEIEFPLSWPDPWRSDSERVVIDLNTGSRPSVVEARIFRSLADDGLPEHQLPDFACEHGESPTTACWVMHDDRDERWKVVLELPRDQGQYFISLKADWVLTPDSSARETTGWLTLDAGWLFAVERP